MKKLENSIFVKVFVQVMVMIMFMVVLTSCNVFNRLFENQNPIYTMVLKPDVEGEVIEKDLDMAVDIINKRMDKKDISVKVIADKQGKLLIVDVYDAKEFHENLFRRFFQQGFLAIREFDETKSDLNGLTLPTGNIIVTGKDIKSASSVEDKDGVYSISIKFNEEGSKKIEEATAKNIGKTLEVYLDELLLFAPLVNEKITNGEVVITLPNVMSKSKEYADYLSEFINLGPLPFKIKDYTFSFDNNGKVFDKDGRPIEEGTSQKNKGTLDSSVVTPTLKAGDDDKGSNSIDDYKKEQEKKNEELNNDPNWKNSKKLN